MSMSKRAADFATLREVIDEVGRDAIRFMDGSAFGLAPGGANRDSLPISAPQEMR